MVILCYNVIKKQLKRLGNQLEYLHKMDTVTGKRGSSCRCSPFRHILVRRIWIESQYVANQSNHEISL